jgi:hypothetical protein
MSTETAQASIVNPYIGKYCIVRSHSQGVLAGYVEDIDGRMVRLRDARQLYTWGSRFVLIELAAYGPRRVNEQRYSAPSVEPVLMLEACGVIPCSDEAAQAIRDIPAEVHE